MWLGMAAKAARTAKAVRAASAVPAGIFLQAAGALEETKSAFYAVTLIAMGVIFLFAADKNTYTSVSAVRSIF